MQAANSLPPSRAQLMAELERYSRRKNQAIELRNFQHEQFTERLSTAVAVQSRWKESLSELNERISVLEDMSRRAQESLLGCQQNLENITQTALLEV